MNERISKIISVIILAALASAGVFGTQNASAWWVDNGNTTENSYKAGELKFKLENESGGETEDKESTLEPEESASRKITISNTGDASIKYSMATEIANSGELCDSLKLTVESESEGEVYNGDPQGFATNSIALDETASWNFDIYLPESGNELQNKTCSFNITFHGRQSNLPEGQGFTHERSVSWAINTNNFAEGEVVINEVMWMGSTKSTADEWIELKNTTDSSIDISGWIIQNSGESNASTTIDQGATISGGGYFLISNDPKSDSAIDITPNQINNIDFNNTYNDNGQLVLKDKNDNVIDKTPDTDSSAWPAGANRTESNDIDVNSSMEINSDGNWDTCSTSTTDIGDYWKEDSEYKNHGTPGHNNSSND